VDEKSLFDKAEITPGRLKQTILLKIKNASQNISAKIFVSGVFHKKVIFNMFR
jgi:hypothetical protein